VAGNLVLADTLNGVTTLTMNSPERLNGWTGPMMASLKQAMAEAAANPQTKAVVLTGTGRYYCAGVNLGATVKLQHPRRLHAFIVDHNQALFDTFLDFPKPLLIAANGPVIGAAVTTATLCDGIIAVPDATFSTPFAALAVPPEGCSSVTFERWFGPSGARMLGPEGWKPTAREAESFGLVEEVVDPDQLGARAQSIAEAWVEAGRERSFRDEMDRDELKAINAEESIRIADAFLSPPFLNGQFEFLWGKKKRAPALMFLALRLSHPLWSRLL
jgi:enoyl-CoA hydratase/carnithine racemase